MGRHAIHVGLVQKRRVREIGAALLRQVGVEENHMTADMIQQAMAANGGLRGSPRVDSHG
jgi:hypothetical protein